MFGLSSGPRLLPLSLGIEISAGNGIRPGPEMGEDPAAGCLGSEFLSSDCLDPDSLAQLSLTWICWPQIHSAQVSRALPMILPLVAS